MSTPLDPVVFAAQALEARGALLEHDPDGLFLLLPDTVARELTVPAELRLGARPDLAGTTFAGLGSALLDQLTQPLRRDVVTSALTLELPAPRLAQAQSLAERMVLRNAVHEIIDAGPRTVPYVLLVISWVAESDDRTEGLLVDAACALDGAAPEPAWIARQSPLGWGLDEPLLPGPQADPGVALSLLARRLERQVRHEHLPALTTSLERRKQRDHERIAAYFGEMIDETRSARRRTAPEAVVAKVAHLLGERDTKLRDLDTRYALTVRLAPVAVVTVAVPSVGVRLRVRRRKESREMLVRLPAGASSLDRLACDGCGGVTARPAVCDDRLHVLCEECAPQATGRIDCPACAARSKR